MTRFEHCLAYVLRHEGGYVDHPDDPGGATNFGITRKTLARWRHIKPWWGLPKSKVQTLKKTEVAAIYYGLYWQRCRASFLDKGLDHALFDFAVNSGPGRAIRHLQALVDVTRDGVLGPVTLKGVNAKIATEGVRALIRQLCAQRLGFLRGLGTFGTFGRGWKRRVAEVQRVALAAAGTDNQQFNNNRKPKMQILSGYKTYIVAVAMLIAGIGQMLGIDLPGFDGQAAGHLIIESLAVLFLRRGLKTEIANA
jgi:lysozyme family protein